jgi:hypothetical protein
LREALRDFSFREAEEFWEDFRMTKALALLALVFCATTYAATDEYVRVEIKGTLHNDFKEHRTTIKANGFVYEVDFGKNDELYRSSERLDRHIVVLNGDLAVENGKNGPIFIVYPNRIADVSENAGYERREVIQEPVVRERVIIREKKPLFKAGPLEIK